MEYKWISGYEGRYDVAFNGTIRSHYWRDKLRDTPQIMNTSDSHGYRTIHAGHKRFNDRKTLSVHRVVAIVWVENPNDYTEVNHIDGDKTNNNASNLEWVSRKENVHHALRTGLTKIQYGEDASNAKLKSSQVLEIFNSKGNIKVLAEMYSVSVLAVRDVKSGRCWSSITGKIKKKKCQI